MTSTVRRFKIVGDLPVAEERTAASRPESDTKALLRTLIAHPGQWVEVARYPLLTTGGHPNSAPYVRAKGLASYGLHTDVRRDGEERVAFARLVPGELP